jgi:hypothetical protein
MPITGSVSPRIRTFLLALAFAVGVLPTAGATASPMASAFSVASACVPAAGPYALVGTDDIAPAVSGWQRTVPLAGTGVDNWEWKVDCGATQTATSGNIAIPGDGAHTLSHRAQESGGGAWTPWVDDTINIDTGIPTNTSAPATGWVRGPYNFSVTGTDTRSPVSYEWRDGSTGPFTAGSSATVTGTGTHTFYTAVVDAAGNRNERADTIKIDSTAPTDNTTAPTGWQHNTVDITVAGADADSGLSFVSWDVDGTVNNGANGVVLHITQQGTHTVKTKIVDNAGNDSGWTTHIVQVDINNPVDTTSVPSGWVQTGTANINVTATDTNGSGVVRIQWDLDNNASSGDVAGPGPVPVAVTGDGVHTLKTRITDAMGDVSGWNTYSIRIDTVNPTDTTSVSSGWLPQSSLQVTIQGTDAHSGVDHIEFKLDNVPGVTTGTASQVINVAGQGEHVLETRVVDKAGNTSPWTARPVRLDATSPDNVTPVIGSTGWRTTSYSVVLNGSDSLSGIDSVYWKVDGGSEHSGTVAVETATVSGNGPHVLQTRVKDVAGNFSGWRSETIKIDNIAPTDTTTYPSAPVPNNRKVPVTGTDADSGIAGVQWQIDSDEVKTSAQAVILGSNGPHTLKTRVQDSAGNWSNWRNGTVTINTLLPMDDTDPPVDTTSIATNWRTGAYTATVSGDDNGGSGVDYIEWRVDGSTIDSGPSGSTFTVSGDGVHQIETRVWDHVALHSEWRTQTLKIDQTQPVITTVAPTGWTGTRTVTLSASDVTSGVEHIEYQIDNASWVTISGASGSFTLSGEGDFTVRQRAYDVAGQAAAISTFHYKIDTVVPVSTTAAAPTAWQTTALALPLTGTDAASGFDHGEWRVDGGTVHTGSTATVSTQGTQLLETRVVDLAGNVSAWRPETIKIDTVKPVNTTVLPSAPWIKTNFSTTVTGTDATPGSGFDRIEYKLDGPTVVTTPGVSITADGPHTLLSRVIDLAGNASDWRTDSIGIDKTAPTLAVDCGSEAWRNTPAACTVTSDGGPSGLPTLTGQIGSGSVDAITGGAYTVDADGSLTINFHAVDGAGNENLATAKVNIDHTSPAPAVDCGPGAGTTWSCRATAVDGLSGIASLAYSVDGSVPVAPAADGSFTVNKGVVTVYAADKAGNGAASAPLGLADRTPPAPPADDTDDTDAAPTPRTRSEAVLLRKGGSTAARLIGQLSIASLPTKTTVDLRPLAIGKGTFQFVFKITAGKKTKTVTKTQTIKTGYSTRILVALGASTKTSVALTVRMKSGKRWTTYAAGSAKL